MANDTGTRSKSRRYNARLTKASLKLPECRVIARQMLIRATEDAVAVILRENLLQKRSLATSRTLVPLLITRLSTVDKETLDLLAHGDTTESALATMAATMKAESLLADFVGQVLKDAVLSYRDAVPNTAWRSFIETCADRDPHVLSWTPEVVSKLRQNVYRMLAEAGYVRDTSSMAIQRVTVPETVAKALVHAGDEAILRLLKVTE